MTQLSETAISCIQLMQADNHALGIAWDRDKQRLHVSIDALRKIINQSDCGSYKQVAREALIEIGAYDAMP